MRASVAFATMASIAAISLGSAVLAQGESAEARNPREQLDAAYPEVPQDVWADYVTALEKEEVFAYGQAMTTGLVRKELADLESKTGLETVTQEEPFLKLCDNKLVYGKNGVFRLRQGRQSVAGSIRVSFHTLERSEANGVQGVFRVPDALLAPLRFDVVTRIILVHPALCRRIESFSAENEPLASIVNRVFEAVNSNWRKDPTLSVAMTAEASSARVTVSAYGLSAYELVSLAADGAGLPLSMRPEARLNQSSGSIVCYGPSHYSAVEPLKFMDERRSMTYDDLAASFPPGGERVDPTPENPYPEMLRNALGSIVKNPGLYKFRIVIGPAAK